MEKKQTFKLGCVMAHFDFPELENIHSKIDPKDIYTEEGDRSYGLEKESHVTLLYGIHSDEVTDDEVFSKIEHVDFKKIQLDTVSIFENEKYDVLKFSAYNDQLPQANKALKQLPFSSDYPDYKPHCTIGYLKPGTGKKYVEMFKDAHYSIVPTKIVYSKPNGDKIEKLIKAFNEDSYIEELIKSLNHKYIKREGVPGNYTYIYQEDKVNNEIIDQKHYKKLLNELKRENDKLKNEIENKKKELEKEFQEENKTFNPSTIQYKVAKDRFINENSSSQFDNLRNKIIENNKKIELLKNQLEPNKINSDKDLDNLIYSAQKEYLLFKRENPITLPMREVDKTINKNNYFIGTDTIFDSILNKDDGYEEIKRKWEELKKKGDWQSSPKSSSEYVVIKDGVYRLSDHWGRAASCVWDINSKSNSKWDIGFSKFEDFKLNGSSAGYIVLNPKFKDEGVDKLNISINKLSIIEHNFSLSKTQKKKIDEKINQLKEDKKKIESFYINKSFVFDEDSYLEDLIKAQDPSHGGKLVKKVITDKNGKKTTKWVSKQEAKQLDRQEKPQDPNESIKYIDNLSTEEKAKLELIKEQIDSGDLTTAKELASKLSDEAKQFIPKDTWKEVHTHKEEDKYEIISEKENRDFFESKMNYITLSENETESLSSYCRSGHKDINAKLRGIKDHKYRDSDDVIDKETKDMDSIFNKIKKSPLSNNITIFRGQQLTNEIASLKPGDIYQDPGFMSTSLLSREGEAFSKKSNQSLMMEIQVPKDTKVVLPWSLERGRLEEAEVILNRDTKLEVVSVDKENNKMVFKII